MRRRLQPWPHLFVVFTLWGSWHLQSLQRVCQPQAGPSFLLWNCHYRLKESTLEDPESLQDEAFSCVFLTDGHASFGGFEDDKKQIKQRGNLNIWPCSLFKQSLGGNLARTVNLRPLTLMVVVRPLCRALTTLMLCWSRCFRWLAYWSANKIIFLKMHFSVEIFQDVLK